MFSYQQKSKLIKPVPWRLHIFSMTISHLYRQQTKSFCSCNAHVKIIRQGRRFQWQINSIWLLLFPHETAQYPVLMLKQSNRNRTKWQLRFHSAGVNEKGKSWCCFCVFSRAVALLFNWKYFGGLKSHQGRCADNMQMTWEVWNITRVDQGWQMSSACHLHIVQKHPHHLHVIHTSSRSMHIIHTSSTAPHKAHWLPPLSWSWIWKH